MKMKPKRQMKRIESIAVTGIDGKTKKFGSVALAAAELEVTKPYIYVALKKDRKIRGCTVEAVY